MSRALPLLLAVALFLGVFVAEAAEPDIAETCLRNYDFAFGTDFWSAYKYNAKPANALNWQEPVALTEENAALKREKAELETSGERWEESTKQFSRLALLEYHLAQENYAVCCELVKELEPLKETLPDGGSYNSGTPDPRSRYNEIVEQLARLGYLAVGADGELSFTEPVG